MFKRALVGLAVCSVCSAIWAQAPPPPVVPAPPPRVVVPAPPPGYNPPPVVVQPTPGVVYPAPGVVYPAPGVVHAVAGPIPTVGVVVPVIRSSPYNPRIDSPPFTMVPDFGALVVERTPVTGTTRTTERTLYERLGGENAIRAVVDDFVARAAANPRVNFTRKGTAAEWKPTPENVDRLKKMLVDLIGMSTGGPQTYKGKNLKESHRDMRITQSEFDAAAADLKASLDKFNVPAKERDELLAIVNSTAKDIVEKQRN